MRNQFYLFVIFFLFLGNKTYSQNSVSLFQGNLTTPNPMIIDGDDIYVGLYYSDKIVKMNLSDPSIPPVDVVTNVNRPYGLAIKDNMLYFSEFMGNKISKINLANTSLAPEIVIPFVNRPIGIEFVGNNLFIALEADNKIVKADVTQASPQLIDVANVTAPFEIEAVDDYLYISERVPLQSFAGKISKISLNSTSTTPTTVVQGLDRPSGIVSYKKQLYIAEAGTSKIVKISTADSNPTVSDAVISSLFDYPSGLAIHDDILYVTDFFASSVFKVEFGALSVSELNSIKNNNIKIYPNPVNDILNVYNSPSEEYKIFDKTGRLINSGTLERNSVNVSQLTEGNYIIKIGEITKKFIKK